MKSVLLAVAATSLALAGCQTAGGSAQPRPVTPVSLSASQISAIQAGMRRSLKDPDSARFGDVMAARAADGTTIVCGYVNARNSFGGYVGMQPFSGVLGDLQGTPVFVAAGMGGSRSSTYAVRTYCAENGLSV